EEFTHIAGHVLEHSVADTLYLIPFLFVTYLVMEWLEHKTGGKAQAAVQRAGAAGPIVGAVVGVVPQCGFSAVAATLWAGRVITLGTLFAVFLSTSDEMLPIFIAEQVPLIVILKILGAKIVVGMVMGFIVDAGMRLARRIDAPLHIHDLCERDHCHCHDGEGGILKSALKHTLQVTVFIFVITIVLNGVLEVVGEDALGEFLSANPVLSVFGSALVGLVPNCAASVVIAQLYVSGVLGSGAMLAGLLVSAGVGLLVLVRTNRHWKQNVAIIVGLYAMGVFWGLIANVLGVVF
ncbi:putative manganese transporter, partial [Gordonibacter pamelaeae]